MGTSAWVTVKSILCPTTGEPAQLLEQREYIGISDEFAAPEYVVRAQRCSCDLECNMNDHISCQWSFKTGDDPFTRVAEISTPIIPSRSYDEEAW